MKADKQERRDLISGTTAALINRNRVVESIDQIRNKVKDDCGKVVSRFEVADVIKNDMNMSYRNLIKMSLHSNSN